MCYSAQAQSEYKRYVRYVGRDNALDIKAFFKKYWERLNDAERTLQTKTTKKAQEDRRIATDKVEWAKTKLSDCFPGLVRTAWDLLLVGRRPSHRAEITQSKAILD